MQHIIFLFFIGIFLLVFTVSIVDADEAKDTLGIENGPERSGTGAQTIKITNDMKGWIGTHFDRNVKGEYLSVSEIEVQNGGYFLKILSGNGKVLRKRAMSSAADAKKILIEINKGDLLINYIDRISSKHREGINNPKRLTETGMATSKPKVINKTHNRVSSTSDSSNLSVGNQNNEPSKVAGQTIATTTKEQTGASQRQGSQAKKLRETVANDTSEKDKDKSLEKARTKTDGTELKTTNTNLPNASGKDEKKVTGYDLMAPAAAAKEWPGYDKLTGSWKSATPFRHTFKFADRIELDLWITYKGELEGAAMIIKNKEHCLGRVKMDRASNRLIFTAMDGSLCRLSKSGTFELFRFLEGQERLGMHYVPAEAENQFKAQPSYYVRTSDHPDTLTDFVRLIKDTDGNYMEAKKASINKQEQNFKQAQDMIRKSTGFNFSGADLIGIWHGQFIDKQRTYPAEIMFWSSSAYRYKEIVGIVRFDGIPYKKDLCLTGIITNKEEKYTRIHINYLHLDAGQDCIPLRGSGLVSLDDNGRSLTLLFNSELTRLSGQKENSFQDFTFPVTGDRCYTVGMFRCGSASEKLKSAINGVPWKTVKDPTQKQKQILLEDSSQLEELKTAHNIAVLENARIRQQVASEKEAVRQKQIGKEQERIAAVRAKKRAEAERIQRNKMIHSQGRPSGSSTAAPVSFPVVHGPFDGLQGGSFLNALYKADWSAIEQFNNAYASQKIQQNKRIMGNSPHWSDGFINAGFKAVRLTNTVLAVYLFDYERSYGGCLKDDAVTFEVVEVVPDVVTKNLLGHEVSRSYGYTSRRYFKVNKEFTAAFRRVGRTKPEGAMSTLSDLFLNQGGTDIRRQLIAGTRQMMNKFSCDSPEIRQIEWNLLKGPR